ncbi:DUF397 domain-containing protein [Streptomyces sp. NPDC048171]|nr:DUF397 domain-containing protein [Streptomyces sp. SID5789]
MQQSRCCGWFWTKPPKTPDGPTLRFRTAAWTAFIGALKAS